MRKRVAIPREREQLSEESSEEFHEFEEEEDEDEEIIKDEVFEECIGLYGI